MTERKILFRGRSLESGYWIFGHYFIDDDNHNNPFRENPINTKHFIRFYNAGDWNLGMWIDEEVDPLTIGQYSEVDDIDGMKIFEGDKCHLDEVYIGDYRERSTDSIVMFCDGSFYFDGVCELDSACVHNRNVKLIGNKYL